jgi:NAD(P)-dependent dehydrogenase (short-subunit alcohol dehydrogenase family)
MGGPVDGKVVVVTGGSKGMGRAFVDTLVAEGAQVGCLARPSQALDRVARDHGAKVAAIECDVRDSAEVNHAIASVAERFGRIDALVNNAAIFHPFEIEQVSDELVDQHIDINLRGIVWLVRAAVPHLRKSRGQIVSISSESVNTPFPMLSLYAATKAAVETFSAGLRDELRKDGIRVSILRSGSVSGGSGGDNWDQQVAQKFYETILRTGHAAMSGASASPESMAQALVALLSMPADVSIDLMEVRAAAEGIPPSVRAATAENE